MKSIGIITGPTSGIGYELTKILANEDIELLLISRNFEKLNQVKSELEKVNKNNIYIIAKDLSELNFDEDINNIIKDKHIKYLINNSGFGDFGLFDECSIEKAMNMIDLNVKALTKLTHLFINHSKKIKKDSYLLNVASVASFIPGPLMATYYATKSYVLSLTLAVRYENRNNKYLHISALCPGPTATNFVKSSNALNSNAFNKFKMMSSKDVAHIGYNSLLKNKKIIIPGILNKIMIVLSKFSPVSLTLKITYFIMKNKK